jgi:hypothetical protein
MERRRVPDLFEYGVPQYVPSIDPRRCLLSARVKTSGIRALIRNRVNRLWCDSTQQANKLVITTLLDDERT